MAPQLVNGNKAYQDPEVGMDTPMMQHEAPPWVLKSWDDHKMQHWHHSKLVKQSEDQVGESVPDTDRGSEVD